MTMIKHSFAVQKKNSNESIQQIANMRKWGETGEQQIFFITLELNATQKNSVIAP